MLSVSSEALPWKKLVRLGPGMWLYCWCRFHRRSTHIKKATSNTTKKMTGVIAKKNIKFKITESMISMITVWNGVTRIISIILCCRTNNESFSIFKTNHIQNYTTLNKKWIFWMSETNNITCIIITCILKILFIVMKTNNINIATMSSWALNNKILF